MRILVSSSGPTAFVATHQGDEEPLPGGWVCGCVPTLTERSKTPAPSSETPAGSLMTRAALHVGNQLREKRKTEVLERPPKGLRNRHKKHRFQILWRKKNMCDLTVRFPLKGTDEERLYY